MTAAALLWIAAHTVTGSQLLAAGRAIDERWVQLLL